MLTKEQTFQNSEDQDVVVYSTLYAGSVGIELFARVFLLAVPVILPALNATDKKTLLEQDIDFNKVASSIVANFSEKKVVKLVMDIVQSTMVIIHKEGDPIKQELSKKHNFDTVFAGNYSLLVKVIKFALEVNFKDFFGENGIKDLVGMIPGIIKR